MSVVVLRPEVVRELLAGHESAIPSMMETDKSRRDSILAQSCPKCGHSMLPVLPSDPAKVFSGTNFNYEAQCPRCSAK